MRSGSRTFAGNPVTPVIESLSMTNAFAPACGTDYCYTLGGKLVCRTWASGIVTTYYAQERSYLNVERKTEGP